jgi:hypothetical protein
MTSAARKSWSAINLFFNTAIDANNVAILMNLGQDQGIMFCLEL